MLVFDVSSHTQGVALISNPRFPLALAGLAAGVSTRSGPSQAERRSCKHPKPLPSQLMTSDVDPGRLSCHNGPGLNK